MAIARALACEPEVLLLDEPFGALDVQTKEDMQVFIRQVWQDTGTTVLMVTHDVEEAVFLGERVVVLASDPGRMVAEIAVELPTTATWRSSAGRSSCPCAPRSRTSSVRSGAVQPSRRRLSGRCDTNGRTTMKYGGVNGGSAPAPGPRRPQ